MLKMYLKNGWVYIICGKGILWEDRNPVATIQAQDNFSNIEFGAMGRGSAALNLHRIINQETKYRGEFQITEYLSIRPLVGKLPRYSELKYDKK